MKSKSQNKRKSKNQVRKRKELARIKKSERIAENASVDTETVVFTETVLTALPMQTKVRVPLFFQMFVGMAGFLSGGFLIFLKIPFFVRLFW
jgi:hypothetical protein